MGAATAERASVPRGSYRYDGVITALAPIHHGGEGSDGTTKPFAVQKVLTPEGEVVELPRVSGNSIRGQWRDLGAALFLRALGLGEQALSPAAFYFLFSGGSLAKAKAEGAKTLEIGAARLLGELLPTVGLFGGGVGTMLLPGKLKVGDALPLCQETAHLVPDAYRDQCGVSIWALRDVAYYSRQDDARGRYGMQFLPPPERAALEAPRRQPAHQAANLFGGEPTGASAPVEEIAAERGVAVQMRYGFETLAAGTRFWHHVSVHDATPVELSALYAILAEWSRAPVLGGKSGTGFGVVRAAYDRWLILDPRVQVTTALVRGSEGLTGPEVFTDHCATHRAAILDALERL